MAVPTSSCGVALSVTSQATAATSSVMSSGGRRTLALVAAAAAAEAVTRRVVFMAVDYPRTPAHPCRNGCRDPGIIPPETPGARQPSGSTLAWALARLDNDRELTRGTDRGGIVAPGGRPGLGSAIGGRAAPCAAPLCPRRPAVRAAASPAATSTSLSARLL